MYKVTIEKIETYTKVMPGEWCIVDTRPYTKEEAEKAYEYQFKNELKEVRGYAPDVKKTIETNTRVLEQTINDLDLVAVIKAINKIEG